MLHVRTPRASMKSALFLSLLAALLLSAPSFGQFAAGSISGTVADSSGAVIPNAKVVLTNDATTAKRETVSNSSGFFNFASIQPATYTLSITVSGFKTYERHGITMTQGGSLTIPAIALEVSVAKEEVQVVSTTEVVVPQDTGQTSQTLNQHMVTELAIQGRDAAVLMKIMPGMGMANGLNQNMFN